MNRLQRRWHHLMESRSTTRTLVRELALPPPAEFGDLAPTASIAAPARIVGAAGIAIGAGVTIGAWSSLTVDDHGQESAAVTIGDDVMIGRFLTLVCHHSVTIAPGARLGESVFVADGDDPGAAIDIGAGALIANLACVVAGASIGANAVVGPGTVVDGHVPAGTAAVGNPFTLIERDHIPWA